MFTSLETEKGISKCPLFLPPFLTPFSYPFSLLNELLPDVSSVWVMGVVTRAAGGRESPVVGSKSVGGGGCSTHVAIVPIKATAVTLTTRSTEGLSLELTASEARVSASSQGVYVDVWLSGQDEARDVTWQESADGAVRGRG